VFLVSQNVPGPFCDGLLFTNPDLLSHLQGNKTILLNVNQMHQLDKENITNIYNNMGKNLTKSFTLPAE